MTFSPLTNYTVDHHGKYNPRYGQSVVRIIVHHWAGTTGGDSRLMNPDQEVSANYILYSDGTLVGQVPEEYRAWTSGSWDADAPSITIETQNSGVGGDWPVSDAAINKLTELIADLGRRYGWGNIEFGSQVRGHREFWATACPGPYLWDRLPQIAANANAMLGGAAPAPVSGGVSGDIDSLAQAVIRGDYGNGPARRAALGAQYDAVQARVNEILSGAAPAPAPAPVSNGDTYTVVNGDSYWAIAEKVWGGDNANINANMHKLQDLNGNKALFAGNTVILNAPAPVAAPEPVVAPTPVVEPTPVETPAEPVVEPATPITEPVVEPKPAPVETPAETVVEPTPTDKGKETMPYTGNKLTEEEYKTIVANVNAQNDTTEVANYNLISKEFWNYAGERVIKTFAMTASAILTTTGAVVVANPESANIFAQVGWVYMGTVAGVSALNSLLVALSSFKNIK